MRVIVKLTLLSVTEPPVSIYMLTSLPESKRFCKMTPEALKEEESIVSENVIIRLPVALLNSLNETSLGADISLVNVTSIPVVRLSDGSPKVSRNASLS